MSKRLVVIRRKNESCLTPQTFIEKMEQWIGYWRLNIHRFIEDYLGLKFRAEFQKVWIYFLDQKPNFIAACSRGLAKRKIGRLIRNS